MHYSLVPCVTCRVYVLVRVCLPGGVLFFGHDGRRVDEDRVLLLDGFEFAAF